MFNLSCIKSNKCLSLSCWTILNSGNNLVVILRLSSIDLDILNEPSASVNPAIHSSTKRPFPGVSPGGDNL